MKTLHRDKAPAIGLEHRAGSIRAFRLLRGDPEDPNNFEFSVCELGGAEPYRTPRHRHNFSQLIFVLRGSYQISPVVHAVEGSVTYSPEGTSYGPQEADGCDLLLLQFGEASGSGFMSYDWLIEGRQRLAERGSFEKGIYVYEDENGHGHKKDSYEAIWEEMRGRPSNYPSPRYETPITIHPSAFAWIPIQREPGMSEKHLGTFSERRTTVGFLKYEQEAAHRVEVDGGPELHFVVEGELRADGQRYGKGTAIMFEAGDAQELRAAEPAIEYVIRLPNFRSIDA